jgi:enediyne biosynthesis protein E4
MGKWSKGISVIDINNDGWMDIYACAAVLPDSNARKNMLFINRGNDPGSGKPVFADMASEYGLADASNTHMAAFFDYDNDGDLDVYLLINDLDGTYPNEFRPIRKDGSWPNTDKLLENNYDSSRRHPVFSDVSKKAGILIEGHGLGINITDINADGWKDIYISNDYISNNVLYVNNRNGTFTDHCADILKHTSKNAMGNDIADINNDGLPDIIEMDMMPADNYRQKMMYSDINYQAFQNSDRYGYIYQYPRNTLQLNQGIAPDSAGLPAFSEIAYLAGVANTDWSWAPLLMDADNDGYRDLMISNGLPRDMSDLDFMAYRKDAVAKTPLEEVLKQLPAVKVHNYIFRNDGKLGFSDMTRTWGWETPGFSTGMACADFDRDGDIDVVVNNSNMTVSLLENTLAQTNNYKDKHYIRMRLRGPSANLNGLGTTIRLYYQGNQQFYEHTPYRGYLSSIENIAHFGLGNAQKIDSVRVEWPGGDTELLVNLQPNQVITLDIKNAQRGNRDTATAPMPALFGDISTSLGLRFGFQEVDFIDFNIQRLIPHKLTRYGPSLAVGDLNGDGLEDLVTGGSSPFNAMIFRQQKSGKFIGKRIVETKTPQLQDDAGLCLFDADKDGDLDLYIASGGAENEPQSKPYMDHFYLNDGRGNFTEHALAITNNRASKSCIAAHDYDLDGDLDLFIGGRVIPGRYPMPASSFLYRNDSRDGKIEFTDVTRSVAPGLQGVGMVTAAIWSDADNDNKKELLLATEWGPLMIFRLEGSQFKKIANGLDAQTGWWNSIIAADIDNDGDMDYVAGNYGTNGYLQPTMARPVRAYVYDFDNNTSLDAVFSSFRRSTLDDTTVREFPLAGRDEFLREMSAMKERFPNYRSYAGADMQQLFKPEALAAAQKFSVFNFHSCWIENKGNFKLEFHPLPTAAQFAPVFGIVARDFDGDGNIDLALNGNAFSMAPYLGRYDALNGLVLQGDGKGNFKPLPPAQSGMYIKGDGKALAEIVLPTGSAIVAVENTGMLRVFGSRLQVSRTVMLSGNEHHALVYLKNGQVRKEEFPIGSGFLTQSTRFVRLDESTSRADIFSINGQKRTVQ